MKFLLLCGLGSLALQLWTERRLSSRLTRLESTIQALQMSVHTSSSRDATTHTHPADQATAIEDNEATPYRGDREIASIVEVPREVTEVLVARDAFSPDAQGEASFELGSIFAPIVDITVCGLQETTPSQEPKSPQTAAEALKTALSKSRLSQTPNSRNRLMSTHALPNQELFEKVPLFRDAPRGFILLIDPFLQHVTFEAQETIMTEGEFGDKMYFILDGTAEGFRRGKSFTFSQGEFFGEMEILRGSLRCATIRAITPCSLLSLSREALLEGCSEYPEVKDGIERIIMFRIESEKYSVSKRSHPGFIAEIQVAVDEQFRRMKQLSAERVRFSLHDKIGSGATGSVFSGFNLVTGQPLAVKVIRLSTDKTKAQTLEVEQESELMQQLRHPNLIQGYGMQTDPKDPGKLYILMELSPLGSLSKVLAHCGVLSEPAVRSYARQALMGLQYLHRHGVVHRDIKPSNMLLAADGAVKLADFGISAAMGQGASQTMAVAGTPAYMSPEAINGKFGVASDLWALGCSIIELLTGRPPWSHKRFEDPMQLLFHICFSGASPPVPLAFRAARLSRSHLSSSGTFLPQSRQTTEVVESGGCYRENDKEDQFNDEYNDCDDASARHIRISPQLRKLLLQLVSLDPQDRGDVACVLSDDWFVLAESQLLPPDRDDEQFSDHHPLIASGSTVLGAGSHYRLASFRSFNNSHTDTLTIVENVVAASVVGAVPQTSDGGCKPRPLGTSWTVFDAQEITRRRMAPWEKQQ